MDAMKRDIVKTSRLTKLVVDKGGRSFEEGEDFFLEQKLVVHVDETVAATRAGQAAILTVVATASRCFLGGVEVRGGGKNEFLLNLPFKNLGAAVHGHGARAVSSPTFSIYIGVQAQSPHEGVALYWDGWRAGVRTANEKVVFGSGNNPLSGIVAAGLGVSQALSFVLGNRRAGRMNWDINLWNPLRPDEVGPSIVGLPKALWFIGLGNLGQAYLWCLGLLPFKNSGDLELVFQDFDFIKPENWITSILTTEDWVGKRKTRLVDEWARARGFTTRIYDFPLNKKFQVPNNEVYYALAGLDSIEARLFLEGCQFPFIVSAGLGATVDDFHHFGLEVFDDFFKPSRIFENSPGSMGNENDLLSLPAYAEGIDEKVPCGKLEIAKSSAAVPFVSIVAAALAVSQLLRISSGFSPARILRGSTIDLGSIRGIEDPKADGLTLGLHSQRVEL